jgi:hypothetical protein
MPDLHEQPTDIDLILTLIGEELKSSKFFSTLRTVGLDDTFYQTNLCSLIFSYAGFEEETNELLDTYVSLLEHYSNQLQANDDSLNKLSYQFYVDLLAIRK